MALEDTALWSEISGVYNDTKTVRKYYHWTLEVIANGAVYESLKVISTDIDRDYVGSYADKIMVVAVFPKGTFEHLIMPYKDNLLCTMKGTPIGQVTGEVSTNQPLPSQQMRGTLIDTGSAILDGNDPYVQDIKAADLNSFSVVRMQLVDLTVEQLRMKSVGGIFRNTKPGDALRTAMLHAISDLKLTKDQTPAGVTMVDPDNTAVRDHIVIPSDRSFLDLPDHIHHNCGGIYSTGMGFYLQNTMWYVYPAYNIKRFNKAKKTITFINLPKNRFIEAEKTYRSTPNQTIVLVTGDTASLDNTESMILNEGNGVRYTDANKIIDGFGKAANNVYEIQRAKNNSEFIVEKRDTGYNHVPVSRKRITSNGYVEMSKMSLRGSRHMIVTWENSDPSLIEPGMPCKFVYLVNDKVMETEGLVIGAHTYTHMKGKGLSDGRHVSKTAVKLLVDKSVPWIDNEPAADTNLMTSTSTPTNA